MEKTGTGGLLSNSWYPTSNPGSAPEITASFMSFARWTNATAKSGWTPITGALVGRAEVALVWVLCQKETPGRIQCRRVHAQVKEQHANGARARSHRGQAPSGGRPFVGATPHRCVADASVCAPNLPLQVHLTTGFTACYDWRVTVSNPCCRHFPHWPISAVRPSGLAQHASARFCYVCHGLDPAVLTKGWGETAPNLKPTTENAEFEGSWKRSSRISDGNVNCVKLIVL